MFTEGKKADHLDIGISGIGEEYAWQNSEDFGNILEADEEISNGSALGGVVVLSDPVMQGCNNVD